ncbi:unnamed protein product [Rotaria sp. Silwood2]|nr:unnamed protein product [Rotaria sp. Silwood2]
MQSSILVAFWLIVGLISFSISATIRADPTNVGIDIAIPRDYTRQQYMKSIIDFWTPERTASVISAEPIITKMQRVPFSGNDKYSGVERILTPSTFAEGIRNAKPTAAGRAFFVMNDKTYVCSGSVVNAANRDTVVTAVFIPQYHSGERPVGTFAGSYLTTKKQYIDKADYNFDVAIVTMDVNEEGDHIQDVVVAFGISLNASTKSEVNAFGFPMNINNGETMSTCAGTSAKPSLFLMPSFSGMQIKCGMGGGSSGGPWLQNSTLILYQARKSQ